MTLGPLKGGTAGRPIARQTNPPRNIVSKGLSNLGVDAVRKSLSVVIATVAMAFAASAPAAADANDHASCAGLAGSSRAGVPGAQAEVVQGVIASEFPPGRVNFSDFASFHDGSAEACLA